jgi:hypothetical protein
MRPKMVSDPKSRKDVDVDSLGVGYVLADCHDDLVGLGFVGSVT